MNYIKTASFPVTWAHTVFLYCGLVLSSDTRTGNRKRKQLVLTVIFKGLSFHDSHGVAFFFLNNTIFKMIFIFVHWRFACMCLCEGCQIPRTGITDSCELPPVGNLPLTRSSQRSPVNPELAIWSWDLIPALTPIWYPSPVCCLFTTTIHLQTRNISVKLYHNGTCSPGSQ